MHFDISEIYMYGSIEDIVINGALRSQCSIFFNVFKMFEIHFFF